MIIAVNGTLMKDQSTNYIMIDAGAIFVRNARIAPIYRLWSIGDKHPAMLRDAHAGASISLELWEITVEKIMNVFEKEPPGLVLGQVLLDNHDSVVGILAEPYILEGAKEINQYLGWREYRSAENSQEHSKPQDPE